MGGGKEKENQFNAIFTVFSVQVTFNNLNMCVLFTALLETACSELGWFSLGTSVLTVG